MSEWFIFTTSVLLGFINPVNPIVAAQSAGWLTYRGPGCVIRHESTIPLASVQRAGEMVSAAASRYGDEWGLLPSSTVEIRLYRSGESFRSRTHRESYLSATWDGRTMHLLLPTGTRRFELLQSMITHEYAHFLLHKRWDGTVPRWFTEGFAAYNSGELSRLPRPAATIHSLARLDSEQTRIRNTLRLRRWYATSATLVFLMIRSYGAETVRRMLLSDTPGNFPQQIAHHLGIPYHLFEQSLLTAYRNRVQGKKPRS